MQNPKLDGHCRYRNCMLLTYPVLFAWLLVIFYSCNEHGSQNPKDEVQVKNDMSSSSLATNKKIVLDTLLLPKNFINDNNLKKLFFQPYFSDTTRGLGLVMFKTNNDTDYDAINFHVLEHRGSKKFKEDSVVIGAQKLGRKKIDTLLKYIGNFDGLYFAPEIYALNGLQYVRYKIGYFRKEGSVTIFTDAEKVTSEKIRTNPSPPAPPKGDTVDPNK